MPQISDNEVQEALAAAQKERDRILSGVCPRCEKQTMEGKPDTLNQGGPSKVVGTWWNHKCSDCGYFCDLIHPDLQ